MPYAIAPREQLEVPMVVWFSDGWRQSAQLSDGCLQARTGKHLSHDNLFHTVLGLMNVTASLYRPEKDIFGACRKQ